MKKPKAYLASPYGFAESSRYFMENIYVPALREFVEVINPWDLTSAAEVVAATKKGRLASFNLEIGKRNEEAIDSADIVIAALDGQEVDSGTASEIGYAAACGKKIFGYRSDFRQTGELESTVNLQVEYFIKNSGGQIVTSLKELKKLLEKEL